MDVLGITYLIENAQQFWSELDDILNFPVDASLEHLDSSLKRFVSFCATYHDSYLSSPLQLEHACNLILDSELFAFHSGRMSEHLLEDAERTTDPHAQYILYNLLLLYGRRRNQTLLRAHTKWLPLIPLLMDHARLEFDAEEEEEFSYGYNGAAGGSSATGRTLAVPVESKLRYLSLCLLYEVCRVQTFTMADLRIFDDDFIEYLFDLVERTRNMQDETLNYSIIKLIVALNEQFMVAALQPHSPNDPAFKITALANGNHHHRHHRERDELEKSANRVLRVLIRRLNSSPTLGGNMIFMLNRAKRTSEDLCMQLLVLKLLYLLFTTKGTEEYFYTNDLCVLVDVFLRELVDFDEESESLRHTYLRVLHPLLTKTQLRTVPYKRPQIVRTLESLIANRKIRDVSPTTERLVARCLSGEWCVHLRKPDPQATVTVVVSGVEDGSMQERGGSPSNDSVASAAAAHTGTRTLGERPKVRSLKSSRSVENLKGSSSVNGYGHNLGGASNLDSILRPRNKSSLTLAVASPPSPPPIPIRKHQRAATADKQRHLDSGGKHSSLDAVVGAILTPVPIHAVSAASLPLISPTPMPSSPTGSTSSVGSTSSTQRRRPPPLPPKERRKPPAIPTGRTNGGATITTIVSSAPSPSPLSRVTPALHS